MPAENDGHPRQRSPIRNEGRKPSKSGMIPIAPPTNKASKKEVMGTTPHAFFPKKLLSES